MFTSGIINQELIFILLQFSSALNMVIVIFEVIVKKLTMMKTTIFKNLTRINFSTLEITIIITLAISYCQRKMNISQLYTKEFHTQKLANKSSN